MFEEILIQSLSELDDDTLNYILESCTEDELSYLEMAIEAVSDADRDQLRSGYKLDVHNGIKGFIKSFRDSGADKWKNLAHDAKTEAARIKNNLKGDGEQTSAHFGDNDVQKIKTKYNDKVERASFTKILNDTLRDDLQERAGRGESVDTKDAARFGRRSKMANKHISILKSDSYRNLVAKRIKDAYDNNKDAQRNVGSLSYRLGNGLKTLREGIKSKIDTWKANRQQNQP